MQAAEEDEEQSEKCVGLLLRWLQAGDLLPGELQARGRRLTAHLLADLTFITQVVEQICPVTRAAQTAECPDEAAPAAAAVAGCLAAVLRDAYAVEVDAEAALRRALRAGEQDMEPLGDIIALWRLVLTFAVCCESKQRHIDCIMQMPADGEAAHRRRPGPRQLAPAAQRPRLALGAAGPREHLGPAVAAGLRRQPAAGRGRTCLR